MSADALTSLLRRLGAGGEVDRDLARLATLEVLDGGVPEPLQVAYLTALRFRGETPEVLAGAVEAARERMIPFDRPAARGPLLDTCGTGGDGSCSFNVSTAAALIAAACGADVAKHGNRSATGNSGSSDVLQALGLRVDGPIETARRALRELGIAFLFAPTFHPALRGLAPIRRQLPFRTLFNLIGPLANPARPEFQLIGVAGGREARLVARTVERLGTTRTAVLTADGLDEVGLAGPTTVAWIEPGRTEERTWTREDFGLPSVGGHELRVAGPEDSAARFRRLLDGEPGPIRSIVLANAAAALLVAGRVEDLRDGVARAGEAIDSGRAADLLDRWGRSTRADDQSARP